MDADTITLSFLGSKLLLPLGRLVLTMAIGLLAANLLEALHWTRFVAKLSSPLARLGHLNEASGASFSLAFFSPAASNALLAERYEAGAMSRKELVLANLFNSSPTFLVHLPTLFSLVFAFLGTRAFVYVGLTFTAALLRTLVTLGLGRVMLSAPEKGPEAAGNREPAKKSRQEILRVTLRRFKKRLGTLLLFTIPIYCAVFAMQQAGWFETAERFMAEHISLLAFLNPQALSIIALHLVAESGAALSAAASLAHAGALAPNEVIMALLVGNILSTPMRAARHQFPSYAGYFKPGLALHLVIMNQGFRVLSLALVACGYYWWAF